MEKTIIFQCGDLMEDKKFNFSVPWNEADPDEQVKFAAKCSDIEWIAIKKIAEKYHIHVNDIKDAVFLSAEEEWNATDGQVSDEDWLYYVQEAFEEELKKKGYIKKIVHEFRIFGYEAIERTATPVSAKSNTNRVYVPKDWTRVMVVRLE